MKLRVLGIMSGTSFDGVDYGLCEIGSRSIRLKGLWSAPYPSSLKKRLWDAATDRASSYEICQMHHDLGRFYAEKAPKISCDLIGLHGQTVFHNPQKKNSATYQLGEPSYIAKTLKASVVSQFRAMDMALGGQGAPLATLFHKTVFSDPKTNVAVNNLGGISNVTYLPTHGKIFSFDTGPGNMLIDLAVKKLTKDKMGYDKAGLLAARGIPCGELIIKWMKHSYFSKRPPKSTGREEFGEVFFEKAFYDCRRQKLSLYDSVATFTHFTVTSIVEAYARFLPKLPDKIVLAGGGADNKTLKSSLTFELRKLQWEHSNKRLIRPLSVLSCEELGWPPQSIEPAAFALLAYNTVNKKYGNIPETTGASRPAVLGQLTPFI